MNKIEKILTENKIPFEKNKNFFVIFDQKIKEKKFSCDFVERYREWNYMRFDLVASTTKDTTWKYIWLTTNRLFPSIYFESKIRHYHEKILLKRMFHKVKKPNYETLDEKFLDFFVKSVQRDKSKKFERIMADYIWNEFKEKYKHLDKEWF